MPNFFIRAVDVGYHSRDDGAEYDRPETAMAAGIQSGVSIATDAVFRGEANAAVEVCVERDDGTAVMRSVIALSVSPLMVPDSASAG